MTALSATSPPRLSIDDSAAASHSRADLPAPRAALYIGCAGWSVPAAHAACFPDGGSHLERYAQVFNSVEINSSFYRPHKPATYRKWAAMVPVGFRFAVKMPRSISHQARLQACLPELGAFLDQAGNLGDRLDCLLLQLPPSLAYNAAMLLPLFDQLRQLHGGPVVCEPRHVSWFNPSVSRALCEHHIARVAADPAPIPRAALPAGDRSMQYLRLHGSPRMYYDAYTETALHRIARQLSRPSRCTSQRWCIFDNTGSATPRSTRSPCWI